MAFAMLSSAGTRNIDAKLIRFGDEMRRRWRFWNVHWNAGRRGTGHSPERRTTTNVGD